MLKVFPALTGFLLASTIAAAAYAQDQVDLLDGTTLQGHVTQQTPGSFVVIQTDDGRIQSIPWSQIRRVTASASTTVSPVSPPPPPPAPVAAAEGHNSTDLLHTPELHFEGGLRLGYSFAGGDYMSGSPLGAASESAGLGGQKGSVPLTLDAGMRIAKYIYVGGFFQYAMLSSQCFSPTTEPGETSTASCSGHDLRVGIDVQLHVVPRGSVDPWIGLGFGHEWLAVNTSESIGSASGTQSVTFDGWNLADLMVGVDLRMPNGLAFGPYLEISSGSFGSYNGSVTSGGNTQTESSDIPTKSSHQWITLGARGTFEVL